MLGREVAVLVNGSILPGRYRVQFDASQLSMGLYVAALQTSFVTMYRIMRLVKRGSLAVCELAI